MGKRPNNNYMRNVILGEPINSRVLSINEYTYSWIPHYKRSVIHRH